MQAINLRKTAIIIGLVVLTLFVFVGRQNINLFQIRGYFSMKILNDDGYIRNCITDEIIGKMPEGLESIPFGGQIQNTTVESSEQRRLSFETVFKQKNWVPEPDRKNQEMASGPGSTLLYAQEVIAALHIIISQLKQQLGVSRIRLLDIPCGDMVWMSQFLRTRNDVDYTGMDIVSDLIVKHRTTYGSRGWNFRHQDIVQNPLNGTFDLILCRMMLQHLFSNDALRVLKHLSDSGSRFLLTTSFSRVNGNGDLPQTAMRFRMLNLELPPFSLIPPVCMARDGFYGDIHGRNHFLGLWELPLQQLKACKSPPIAISVPKFSDTFFSCANWSLPV